MRVVVVEDQDDLREEIVIFLNRLGMDTEGASTSIELDRIIANRKPDLILLDIGLPGEDGISIAKRLKERKAKNNSPLIVGGNIGKNKVTETSDAWKDYCTNFVGLEEVVDYFVVNVSSPNTPGLRELQEKESLRKIFAALQNLNKNNKPILLKMAPDLETSALDDIIALTNEIKIDGLVATNTTIDRSLLNTMNQEKGKKMGAGGLSGQPLLEKSNEVLKPV